MIIASRPLRFLALTLGGWTVVRIVWLWPQIDSVPDVLRAIAPIPRAVAEVPSASLPRGPRLVIPLAPRATDYVAHRPVQSPAVGAAIVHVTIPPRVRRVADPTRIALALAAPVGFGPAEEIAATPVTAGRRAIGFGTRLSASSWLIARPGGRALPFTSQLGGSQAGVRLTYALGDSRRLALAARFSSALGSRQREAALGFDWQPTRLPVHLFAEQRFGLQQARGGPSLGLIAGLPPTPVAAGFALEGYGQAGGIARGGIEGFADGSLRLSRSLATLGALRLDAGAGVWGGAQRGAARLDLGPSLGVAVPMAGRTLRLSLDWRQRIAGRAAPGSGPALSLGSDF